MTHFVHLFCDAHFDVREQYGFCGNSLISVGYKSNAEKEALLDIHIHCMSVGV